MSRNIIVKKDKLFECVDCKNQYHGDRIPVGYTCLCSSEQFKEISK